MAKLICDFDALESKKEKIKTLMSDYNAIVKTLMSIESDTEMIWESLSQKAYYEKIIERKAELEQLSLYYEEMISFLERVPKCYKSIEEKYV